MRYSYPLEYFKTGTSSYYVFVHCAEGKKKEFVEDYDTDYSDDKSLVELIGNMIARETGDEKYAWKMVQVLAKKLGIDKDLRDKPLNSDKWLDKVIGKEKQKKLTKKNKVCNSINFLI